MWLKATRPNGLRAPAPRVSRNFAVVGKSGTLRSETEVGQQRANQKPLHIVSEVKGFVLKGPPAAKTNPLRSPPVNHKTAQINAPGGASDLKFRRASVGQNEISRQSRLKRGRRLK